jgi:3-oxoacyl-[acyl-carrier-protein] synthase III
MPERYAKITGWGKYVPSRVLTNADLEKMVETTDEWILSRTGIKERRLRAPDENSSDFSVNAARPALALAGITPKDLDLIIVACSSPDYLVPGMATLVQHKLGAQCGAFQITAGCSGWVYALVTASQFITSGSMNNILVIGTDLVSFGVDYTDRNTCVLFGDASAAVVLQASEQPAGILTYELGSDGSGVEHLFVPGAGSVKPIGTYAKELVEDRLGFMRMNGPEVFKFATRTLSSSMKRVVDKAGLLSDDINLFIPHQANLRIIESAARMMRQPMEKFFVNIQKYGNTSAASVPLALVEAIEEGRCKAGDKVVLCAFGAGLTWASAVVMLGEGEVSPAHTWLSVGRAQYMAKRTLGKFQDLAQNFLLNMTIRRAEKRAASKKKSSVK